MPIRKAQVPVPPARPVVSVSRKTSREGSGIAASFSSRLSGLKSAEGKRLPRHEEFTARVLHYLALHILFDSLSESLSGQLADGFRLIQAAQVLERPLEFLVAVAGAGVALKLAEFVVEIHI
jgi:hypothetical protein